MTQGFYEQLGLAPAASEREIRAAYVRVVGEIHRRRKALVEQGGDTTRLDAHRQQIDEAWGVLSDAVRRRRYDAFLALQQTGWTTDPEQMWKRVSGALVHPAAAAAAEVLRVGTTLAVGALPPAPRPGGPADMAAEVTAHRTQPTMVPGPGDAGDDYSAPVVPLPTASSTPPNASFQVVNGAQTSAPVIIMPTPTATRRDLDDQGIAALVDEHGYSGSLLREVRMARGLSLQDMSDSSRISVRYLEAVEQDDFERLPSATFVRGYVREMARLLDLEESRVVDGYMRRFSGEA